MDTTAEEITFDASGVCSFCHDFDTRLKSRWRPNAEGEAYLQETADRIRTAGADKDYDCLFGLSGGVDSSFMALQIKRLGLRPLVVHVDTGWNSELAVHNIETVIKHLDFDLHTEVIDWDEMRDLQVAFFRAGVPNQDIPQDNAIFVTLHRVAIEAGIKFVFQGFNIVTESILPRSWGFDNQDSRHIRNIHERFGTGQLESYPLFDFEELCSQRFGYPNPVPYETVVPLDHLPYDKPEVIKTISEELGWRDYGTKHGESRFTKFYQEYFLPERFGFDKRRPHYSSLIQAGQLTREAALERLEAPPYDPDQLAEDRAYFIKKLDVSETEFEHFLNGPIRPHRMFPNYEDALKAAEQLAQHANNLRGMWNQLAAQAG